MDQPMPRPSRGRLAYPAVALAIAMILAGSTLATPLYGSYQRAFEFSSLTLTLVFATFIAAMVPTLLIFGAVGDAVGRRPVILTALTAALAGSALFAAAENTAALFIARALQGVAVGAVAGTGAAALLESQPRRDPRRAATLHTAVFIGGGGGGALLAGALAEYGPAPLVLPFLLHLALLTAVGLAVLVMTEPLPTAGRTPWRPRLPAPPAGTRIRFLVPATATGIAFAVNGLYLAIVPSYLHDLLDSSNLAVAGTAVAIFFAAGAAAQLGARHWAPRPTAQRGLALVVAGLAATIAAGPAQCAALVLVGAVVGGTGQGLVFVGCLTITNALAPAERRGELASLFTAIAYLGVGLPVIAVGALAQPLGLYPAVRAFAIAITVACVAAIPALTATTRHSPQPSSPREVPP